MARINVGYGQTPTNQHRNGRDFYSTLAQLVERPTVNRMVPGSSPGGGAMEAQETGDSSGLENRGSARAWGFDSLRFREDILGRYASWFEAA